MLRIFIVTALLVHLSGHANAIETRFKLVAESAGESSYSGQAIIHGTYEIFEDGELCVVLNKSQASQIPLAKGGARICFANQDAVLSALKLQDEIKAIDLKTICGLKGRASVNITGLTTGVGPASRWFTTNLTSATRVSKPKRVPCHG